MKWDNNNLVFETTGRYFYANGYVGIQMIDSENVGIAEGYDGKIYVMPELTQEYSEGDKMTKEEREELADYMISLWEKFKQNQ